MAMYSSNCNLKFEIFEISMDNLSRLVDNRTIEKRIEEVKIYVISKKLGVILHAKY